jgi:hypothetical protein
VRGRPTRGEEDLVMPPTPMVMSIFVFWKGEERVEEEIERLKRGEEEDGDEKSLLPWLETRSVLQPS